MTENVNPWTNRDAIRDEEIKQLKAQVNALNQMTDKELEDHAESRAWTLDAKAAEMLEKRLKARGDVTDWELTHLEIQNLRAREAAKKYVDAEKNTSGYHCLTVKPLFELLKTPDPVEQWRINGLMQIGHNVTIAARYKVGKTTLITNLLRSLVDGTPFLNDFAVTKVTKPVVVFNHELSDTQFTKWLRTAGIVNTHMIIPVNLRGQGLYLQDEAAQDWAIDLLKSVEAEVWIIDPLQAALHGTVNDDTVASEWIAAADRVKAEAGVSELLLVTHTGHLSKADEYGRSANERSAGSARWAGWPDALWTYTMDEDGVRYIAAEGRDISVEEIGLNYDEATRHLTSKGKDSGRVDAKINRPFSMLRDLFKANPESHFTRQQLETELRKSNKFITDAVRDGISSGVIEDCKESESCDHRTSGRGPKPNSYRLTSQGKWWIKRQ